MTELAVWDAAEWEAVRALPKAWTPDEWAERRLVLPAADHAEPGPYRASRTPYVRGPLTAFVDPVVEFVTICTAPQVAKTMMLMMIAGYTTDQEPSPVLVVEPTRMMLDKLNVRFDRLMLASPGFAENLAGDKNAVKGYQKQFRRNTIYEAWAGSDANLAGTPIRIVLLDEVDKYPQSQAGHGTPSLQAIERTNNFPGRKIVRTCTPSTDYGEIWVELQASLVHVFVVPCPECLGYQLLVFRGDREGRYGVCGTEARERGAAVASAAGRTLGPPYGVEWPEGERDWRKIHTQHLAWYGCRWCGARIETWQKPGLLARGVWLAGEFLSGEEASGGVVLTEASERFLEDFGPVLRAAGGSEQAEELLGGRLARDVAPRLLAWLDGLDEAERERILDEREAAERLERMREWRAEWSSHVGFWLPGLYSPFHARSWHSFAATFLRYKDNAEQLKTFRQDWQGLPWTEDRIKTTIEGLRARCRELPRGQVPRWAQVLTAGVDVHKGRYNVLIEAWGPLGQSAAILIGEYESAEAAKQVLFGTRYPYVHSPEVSLSVVMGFWDSSWETDAQYEECRLEPDRLRPIKGEPGTRMGGRPWSVSVLDRNPRTGKAYPGGLALVRVNTDYYKDAVVLRRFITPAGDPGDFSFYADCPDRFLEELTAEEKRRERVRRTGRLIEEWVVVDGKPNHTLDAKVYSEAAADYIGARMLPALPVPSPEGAGAERHGRAAVPDGRATGGWQRRRQSRW